MKKKRISVILSVNTIKAVCESMLKDNYSLREKSKWISEAIEDFLDLAQYKSLVEIAGLVDDFEKMQTFYITSELEDKLDNAILKVRQDYPTLEGVKSLIIRASIVRRLVVLGKRNKK